MDDTLRVFRVGSSSCSATFSCTSSSSNVRDKITTVFVATEGKGYSSSSSKSCRPKSLLQEMSDPIVPVVSWYVVFERENFKYFSLQIFLSSNISLFKYFSLQCFCYVTRLTRMSLTHTVQENHLKNQRSNVHSIVTNARTQVCV